MASRAICRAGCCFVCARRTRIARKKVAVEASITDTGRAASRQCSGIAGASYARRCAGRCFVGANLALGACVCQTLDRPPRRTCREAGVAYAGRELVRSCFRGECILRAGYAGVRSRCCFVSTLSARGACIGSSTCALRANAIICLRAASCTRSTGCDAVTRAHRALCVASKVFVCTNDTCLTATIMQRVASSTHAGSSTGRACCTGFVHAAVLACVRTR